MDFLDPKKMRRRAALMVVGYICVGIAATLATVVLIELAFGFGIGKNGHVVQNGLVFISSSPSSADIALTGVKTEARTNARLSLLSGNYRLTLTRTGYRPWHTSIAVAGGSVLRIGYPLLVPTDLKTSVLKTYTASPGLATQSPDKRWLLVQLPGSNDQFGVIDLKNPKTTPFELQLPTTVYTAGTTQTWALGEWADDNQHVLLNHVADGKSEYILLDRTDPNKTVNVSQALNTSSTKITLLNKKYDQYYLYDTTAQTLQTASLSAPVPQPLLTNVLAYHTYGTDTVLYVSDKDATDGKVAVDLLEGGKTYALRQLASGSSYLLDLTRYNGTWYVLVGATTENKVYVYKDPAAQLTTAQSVAVPVYILKTPSPNYVSFSSNAQYVMAENGPQFSVYDIENDRGYQYDTRLPIDAPQLHASWMDSARLDYVSNGKLTIFDYNNGNQQVLMSASAGYVPFFAADYKSVAVLAGVTGTETDLTSTPLLTAADQ